MLHPGGFDEEYDSLADTVILEPGSFTIYVEPVEEPLPEYFMEGGEG